MPRKADKEMGYLTMHDGLWRVSMGVPRELRPRLGSRLVKSTGTSKKAEAKAYRDVVIPQFKKRIADAWAAMGGKKNSLLAMALETRKLMETSTEDLQEFMLQGASERIEEMLEEDADIRWIRANDGSMIRQRTPKPEAIRKASEFRRALNGEIQIGYHHADFVKSLKTKARSKLDEPRALGILLDWLEAHDIEPYIENVTKPVAVRFMDHMDADTNLSWASKAKYFGRIKFYWAWLARREHAKENVFRDLNLLKSDTDRADDERPYTDEEVQKLLTGRPMEGHRMLDVVMIAALTGARLDAVVDLKVGHLADGYFSFKKQKKERSGRDIPVHPDLAEIVARRIRGKAPEDELFPEWPDTPETSTRPRSAYFSKRYTKYTSDLGVREEEEGRRRSKVNFHSWRRWFITKLERARVREPLIAAIVGHKRPGLTLGLYSGGPEFEEAKDAIALVKLPPLDGSRVPEERSLTPRRRRA